MTDQLHEALTGNSQEFYDDMGSKGRVLKLYKIHVSSYRNFLDPPPEMTITLVRRKTWLRRKWALKALDRMLALGWEAEITEQTFLLYKEETI